MTKHTGRDEAWTVALDAVLAGDRVDWRIVEAEADVGERTARDVVATLDELGFLREHSDRLVRGFVAGDRLADSELVDDDDRPDDPRGPGVDDADGDDAGADRREPDPATDWLDELDTPTETPTREAFEAASRAVVAHIESEGSTRRSTTINAVHDEHPAGYGNERTWWRRIARPTLAEHPDVTAPDKGGSTWSYATD